MSQPSTNRLGQATAAQRVARAMNNPNEPTACKKCGSIYFMEVTAQIYTSGSYGFRTVSTMPMKVYVCPCGELQIPPGQNSGIQAGGERDLFAQSLAAALAYRSETGVDAVAKGTASIAELRELQAEVAELRALLTSGDTLEPVAEHPQTEEPVDAVQPAMHAPALDTEKARVEVPLVASGTRGRSQAAATIPSGDVKFVEPPQREIVTGGARGRMKRQGQ